MYKFYLNLVHLYSSFLYFYQKNLQSSEIDVFPYDVESECPASVCIVHVVKPLEAEGIQVPRRSSRVKTSSIV